MFNVYTQKWLNILYTYIVADGRRKPKAISTAGEIPQ